MTHFNWRVVGYDRLVFRLGAKTAIKMRTNSDAIWVKIDINLSPELRMRYEICDKPRYQLAVGDDLKSPPRKT